MALPKSCGNCIDMADTVIKVDNVSKKFPCLSGWAIILLSGVGRRARQDVGQQFAVWIHAEVRSLAHQYLR